MRQTNESIENISRLFEIDKAMNSFQRELILLSRPIIKDATEISIVNGLLSCTNISNDAKLFAITYACSPLSIIGRYMNRGVRDILKELYQKKNATTISIRMSRAKFKYRTYCDFRDEVAIGMRVIQNFLEKKQ